jgi:RimJ/RimL family protein N-acetyltransferase
MEDQLMLRPVPDNALSLFDRLSNDPGGTGPHEWHGWSDSGAWRRRWADTGLLGDSGGVLMVIRGADRVGFVSWRKVQTGQISYCWAIGICVAPEFRGRGYGSAAQQLLAQYLFAHTQVNRIQAEVEMTNLAEQRALEHAGFTREGVLRGATFRFGQWHDQVLYSVLRDEVEIGADGSGVPGLA